MGEPNSPPDDGEETLPSRDDRKRVIVAGDVPVRHRNRRRRNDFLSAPYRVGANENNLRLLT
jgi:hypothetical protein